MRHVADLATLDLNLLRVFDAVARERHVTRAAEKLNLSQPAVSNALTRLRAALGDELFLRRPGGVEPTALALSLTGPVAEVLDRLRQTLAVNAPFDPATTERVFTVAFSEYAESVLAPSLLEAMGRQAPHALLAIRHADRTNALELLDSGEAEMAVAVLPDPPALYTRVLLLPEVFVTVMRPGHELATGEMTLKRFTSVPHLLHSPNGSRDGLPAPPWGGGRASRRGAGDPGAHGDGDDAVLAPRAEAGGGAWAGAAPLPGGDRALALVARLPPPLRSRCRPCLAAPPAAGSRA